MVDDIAPQQVDAFIRGGRQRSIAEIFYAVWVHRSSLILINMKKLRNCLVAPEPRGGEQDSGCASARPRASAARAGVAAPLHMDSGRLRRDNASMIPTSPTERPRPHSLGALFLAFTVLALQGFGGVLAVVQREIVERRQWLSEDEFIEEWAVAQIMPGPNVINLALILGGRYFGAAGALAALAGMLSAPLLLVLLLAWLHGRLGDQPAVAGALRGMAAVSAGLIGATGLRLAAALTRNPMPLAWCAALGAAGFVLAALLRAPLAAVLAGVGGLGWLLAYRRLIP